MNVLAIGDLHEPFCLSTYLKHCKKIYKQEKCNQVVFIGDVIDSHYSSYHETDPDGMSALDELNLAIKRLRKWYKAFPLAHVTIGNHDRIVSRKAMTAGISKRWVRDYHDVLETPLWKFVEEVSIDGVQYLHGEGGTARKKAKDDMTSTVQGHLHTQCYTETLVGKNYSVEAMQIGCGIDHESYAMAYAKKGKKPVVSCGVIKNGAMSTHKMDL